MTRLALFLLLMAVPAATQTAASADLLKRVDELKRVIDVAEWKRAAELSTSLKEAIREARDLALAAGSGELVDSFLQWLPVDTETVMVAQPFSIPKHDPNAMPSALSMSQALTLMPMTGAEEETLEETLHGRTVRFAALGARKFSDRPHGPDIDPFGMISFQRCGVYSFTDSAPEIARPRDESIIGHEVWISHGKPKETYYVTHLKPDLILACNNREFLTEMLSRIGLPQKERALPQALPIWKYVDRSAPVWAVRQYRTDRADVDPSIVMELRDVKPTGLAVAFAKGTLAARAIMISGADPWKELVLYPEIHGAGQSRSPSAGVWEVEIQNRPEAAGMAVLALMGMLGFVILL